MSLRIEPPVESLVQGETVLFQHADAAYGQGLPLPDAFQPAAVHLLCGLRGFRLRHAARRQHAGDLLHQRHPPPLRGERHRPVGRPHAPARQPLRPAALHAERSHLRQENLPACGQDVSHDPADLFLHRIAAHRFRFLCEFPEADPDPGTVFGPGTATDTAGRVIPRQII